MVSEYRNELSTADKRFVYDIEKIKQKLGKLSFDSGKGLDYKRIQKPKRILITGGTGWLGRHLVDEISQVASVIVPVRSENIKHARERVEDFGWGGNVKIISIDKLSGLEDMQVDSVLHSAANMSLALTMDGAWESNVELMINMYEWAKRNGASSFHHVSTLSVFVASDRDSGLIKECDQLDLMKRMYGGYGASKWAGEWWLMGQKSKDIDICIHRPGLLSWSKTWGWNKQDSLYQLIGAVNRWGWPGKTMKSKGFKMDWSETSEVARGISRCVLGGHGGIFHWANSESVRGDVLIGIIRDVFDKECDKWPLNDTLGKSASRSIQRLICEKKWERWWWQDLFQSTHHFYDGENANKIQKMQTLDLKEIERAVREVKF